MQASFIGSRDSSVCVANRKKTCGRELVLAVILFVGLMIPSSFAQTGGQGAIEGTVKDATGAVVPDATVTVTDQASGVSTTRVTSSAGLYSVTPLIPDSYTWTVLAKGFQT